MGRIQLSQLVTVTVLLSIAVGCGTATTASIPSPATPIPPTGFSVPTIPVATELKCWTVATTVEPGSPPKLGGTNVQVAFVDYAYDAIVGGGGFVVPTGGHIGSVNIAGKAVTLSRHDFGKGAIDTQEFGSMDVLFKANIASECAVLVATSEQFSTLAKWIQSPAAPVTPPPFAAGTLVTASNPLGMAGFWKAIGNQTLSISTVDTQGKQATLEVQGTVRWDKDGKITEGAENFLRIQTKADPNRWYKITNSEVLDGLLILTAEEGIYSSFTEGHSATASTRAPQAVMRTADGNWKGQASFIVTGYNSMNFGATIYQDTRNYTLGTGTLVPAQTSAPQPLPTLPPSPTPTNLPTRTPTSLASPTPYYRPVHTLTLPTPGPPVEGVYASMPLFVGSRGLVEQFSFRVVGWQVTDIKWIFLAGGNGAVCTLTVSGTLPIQKDQSFTSAGYLPDEMGFYLSGGLRPFGPGSSASLEWNAKSCGDTPLPSPEGGIATLYWSSQSTSTPAPRSITPSLLVQTPSAVSTTAPLMPPSTPGINCSNPLARFTAPGMNAIISGTQIFTGTANTPDFAFYKVQYMPDASWGTDKWGELYKSANRIQDGTLFEWQTRTVAPGGYWLRLVVTNASGNYGEPCTLHVTVTY